MLDAQARFHESDAAGDDAHASRAYKVRSSFVVWVTVHGSFDQRATFDIMVS